MHTLMSRDNAKRQNHDTEVANKFSEKVANLKHFGTTETNQNSICEEIKCRINYGNACCHVLQNILFSPLHLGTSILESTR
jgi:hypothetical protein